MEKHQHPMPSEILQCWKFNSCFLKQGESVSSYVAELRASAAYRNYRTNLNDMLRDRLVRGISNDHIQWNLLSKWSLTFEIALEIATGLETASKNADDLKQTFQQPTPTPNTHTLRSVNSQEEKKRKSTRRPGRKTDCYRCGGMNHSQQDC